MMRFLVAAALLATSLTALPARAGEDLWAMSCNQLWFERNSLYKDHGYCFRTQDAIRTFGNDGCWIRDERRVAFSPEERRLISQITLVEKAKYCN